MNSIATIVLSMMAMMNTLPSPPTPIGEFEVTAYTYECVGEESLTATETKPVPYGSVAVDPERIPLGSELYIEDVGWVVATDTGGAVKGDVIDLFVGYDDGIQWGRRTRKVWVKND